MFEGKMYKDVFVYQARIVKNYTYLYELDGDYLDDFPYSEREEYAKKCYKEFPDNFALSTSDNARKNKEQNGMCRYLSVFCDWRDDEIIVTLEEMESEFKRRVGL